MDPGHSNTSFALGSNMIYILVRKQSFPFKPLSPTRATQVRKSAPVQKPDPLFEELLERFPQISLSPWLNPKPCSTRTAGYMPAFVFN